MKIVAIVGSPRTNGNTNYLVEQALQEAAKKGIETEKFILSQYRIAPCQGHENCAKFTACKQDDDARWLLEKYTNADGIILGTPVYYYNMSAQMKIFIDRNYFMYTHKQHLKAKCVGLVIVAGSDGLDQTLRAMKRSLYLMPGIHRDLIFTVAGLATKPGTVENNTALVEEARKIGRQMADHLLS